jgi:hypothetical protein
MKYFSGERLLESERVLREAGAIERLPPEKDFDSERYCSHGHELRAKDARPSNSANISA